MPEISLSRVYKIIIIKVSIDARHSFKHVVYNVHNSPGALLFQEVVICLGSDGEWRSRSQSQGHDSRARILAQNRHA